MIIIRLSKFFLKSIVFLGVFILFFSIQLYAQPTFVAEKDYPTDNLVGGSTTATITLTSPPATLQAQDLVIVYAHYRGNTTLAIGNAGGQAWNTATAVAGGSNQSFAIFWCIYNGTWAANPTVTGGTAGNPLSAIMYGFRTSVPGNSWVLHLGPNNAGPTNAAPITITGLTTTVANTVTMGFWGSPSNTTWSAVPTGAGWSKTGLSQQVRNLGGSFQSHTAAYNIQATAGAVANVTQTQSVAQNTRTSIVSWAEVSTPTNDLCTGATPINSVTSCGATNGSLTGSNFTSSPGACGTLRTDVWYSFTAQTTNPTITIGTLANARFEVISGGCSTPTSVFCSTAASQTVTGLTIGTSYLVRVYSTTATTGPLTICIVDAAPANNAFGSATSLVPSTTCSGTDGTLYLGTYALGVPTISGSCVSGTVSSDVWYTFVASQDIATITLNNAGSDVTGVEIMTTISGTTYSIACGGPTGIPTVNVVAGNTYYVRVYKTGSAPSPGVNSAFNICITVPYITNDECSGAISLNVSANCSKVFGTVSTSTLSTGFGTTGTCTGSGSAAYDVWYKFVATTTNPTISLGDFGSSFTGTRRAELYSGLCGALVPLNQCGAPSITASGLIVGNTYYVRVYSTSALTIGNGKFSICITSGATSNVRSGNSYVNITKNTTGGVVEPGDILEIRMTIWIGFGATLYNARYVDDIPSKTTMTGNEIQIITNEGLRYRGYTATDGVYDDAATYKSSLGAGEYNIRTNLGTTGTLPSSPVDNTATNLTGASTLVSTGTAVPRAGGGLMFAVAYRVQVSGNVGDTIKLNGGMFLYRTAAASIADSIITGTPYKILISKPLTLCSNSVGVNNASEFGGTFGSGSTLNRSTDLTNPIAGYTFVAASSAQAVGDGQYALVNNTSPRGGINQSANKKNVCPANVAPDLLCDNRMFTGYWYINGDHTGTSNAVGNNPTAPGTTGGYMLAVNADYVASEAYRQQLTGLCPNTYYEFSAWFKNICPSCGSDSTGAQFAGTPTAPSAGYVGVYPNLSFALDGLDRYSTGQIDAIAENGGWTKKGFVFKTDTTQTTATLSIRNNAQGGGGNDWVMDDINIATCFPSMSYSPTATPSVCAGNTIQIGDTVRSQFSNYTYYVWQRSVNGGITWTDLTTPQTATPTLVSGQYQYITTLNVPNTNTTLADSGDIYRVYTATTIPNIINPNCVANDGSTPISLSVLNCGIGLSTDLLSFNGNLMNNYSVLSWSTSTEDMPVHFELQRSDDNSLFNTIAIVNGKNDGQSANYYSFTDPQLLTGKKWYRILMIFNNAKIKYSQVIQLSTTVPDFEIENIINPFSSKLAFNIITRRSSKADLELIDMQGKIVKSGSYIIYAGSNSIQVPNTDVLSPGIYTLRLKSNDKIINKKVMKLNSL
ncbi:MAG: T9SS type A sorting domain-containing protein [Bacteroidetes bacterium]|nr:T9SS type A sorting domain-containing protein [Bacteroidota bacterium]